MAHLKRISDTEKAFSLQARTERHGGGADRSSQLLAHIGHNWNKDIARRRASRHEQFEIKERESRRSFVPAAKPKKRDYRPSYGIGSYEPHQFHDPNHRFQVSDHRRATVSST